MLISILEIILTILGFLAIASVVIGLLLLPVVLYKGLLKKDWKLGKICAIAVSAGIVIQIIVFSLHAVIRLLQR